MEKGLIIYIVRSESCGVEELIQKVAQCHQASFNNNGGIGFIKDIVKISFDKKLEDGITIKVSSREELKLGDKRLSDTYCYELGGDIANGVYKNDGDQKIDKYLNAVWCWAQALRQAIPNVQIIQKKLIVG